MASENCAENCAQNCDENCAVIARACKSSIIASFASICCSSCSRIPPSFVPPSAVPIFDTASFAHCPARFCIELVRASFPSVRSIVVCTCSSVS